MADLKALEGLEGQERIDAIVAMFDGGKALPRDLAIGTVGAARHVGWWDMFGPLEQAILGDARAIADKLEPGDAARCDRGQITEPIWTRHRVKHADPSRHGLKLADEPAACVVFKYADGGVGLAVGYAEA